MSEWRDSPPVTCALRGSDGYRASVAEECLVRRIEEDTAGGCKRQEEEHRASQDGGT